MYRGLLKYRPVYSSDTCLYSCYLVECNFDWEPRCKWQMDYSWFTVGTQCAAGGSAHHLKQALWAACVSHGRAVQLSAHARFNNVEQWTVHSALNGVIVMAWWGMWMAPVRIGGVFPVGCPLTIVVCTWINERCIAQQSGWSVHAEQDMGKAQISHVMILMEHFTFCKYTVSSGRVPSVETSCTTGKGKELITGLCWTAGQDMRRRRRRRRVFFICQHGVHNAAVMPPEVSSSFGHLVYHTHCFQILFPTLIVPGCSSSQGHYPSWANWR